MNNINSNIIQDLISKLPITLYFSQLPDRKQALKYIEWLYSNKPESKLVDQDKFYREIICKELRTVSMKIIEIEILFMVGLKTITLEDFTLDNKNLIQKLINENHDKNDLDLMYRILAQIMTKLPMDLREQVVGKHKLQIFQSISKFIKMDPKLLEKFIDFDPSLNTPITMELDDSDYNTLNKKYLDELKKYNASQPYVNSDSMEYEKLATAMLESKPKPTNVLKGQYIDTEPQIMIGANDNKIYYFDSSSGTISEMLVSGKNQIPVSLKDLSNILQENKVDKTQINNLLSSLQTTTTIPKIVNTTTAATVPVTTHPISFINSIVDTIMSNFSCKPLTIYTPTKECKQIQMIQPTQIASPTPPSPPMFLMRKDDKSCQFNIPNIPNNTINSDSTSVKKDIYHNKKNKYSKPKPSKSSKSSKSGRSGKFNKYSKSSIPTLPTLPTLPTFPDIPNIPNIPNIPDMPDMPDMLNMPDISDISDMYGIPNMPLNSSSYYNPNDFINPTNPIVFNPNYNSILPQITSDFITRNDTCSMPNPPASCATKTRPNITNPNNKYLENKFNMYDSTYKQNPVTKQISAFTNMNSDTSDLINIISKKNNDIENVAIAFVSIIVLLFLLVIFNSIRNKNGLIKTK